MPASSTGPECLRVTPDYAFGSWEDLFFCCWRVHTTLAGAEEAMAYCEGFAASRPAGIGMLTIVEANAPAPNNDARHAIARFLRSATYLRASAVAFEGSGFRAAVVRSVVSGLTMLARQPFEHKVFDSVATAAGWLIPELARHQPTSFSPLQAAQAVDDFRSRVAVEVPRRRD